MYKIKRIFEVVQLTQTGQDGLDAERHVDLAIRRDPGMSL